MVDWNDRTVKAPGDFCEAIYAETGGVTPQFAIGYAQALYDARVADMEGMGRYAVEVAKAEFKHNLRFPGDVEPEIGDDGTWS